jgi:hypothetical protein
MFDEFAPEEFLLGDEDACLPRILMRGRKMLTPSTKKTKRRKTMLRTTSKTKR